MSRHPSLKIKDSDLQHRNVLKRFERIAMFLKKSGEEGIEVFKLPKYKRKRLKALKKEPKKEELEGAEQAVEGRTDKPAEDSVKEKS
ncbi:MAG: hypothetical protein P9L98_04120 [Candidatus Kaelpia imicola]|nr:hypothetical protein [Candidatus Kaelpia imicola]